MDNNMKKLLEEFLDPEFVEPIVKRANELELSLTVKNIKGRWHRETLNKLKKEKGEWCESCRAKETKLTLDHIIPKKILMELGLEDYYKDERNLQILCLKCNNSKASQLDFINPKTIVLLEKYISIYKERRAL